MSSAIEYLINGLLFGATYSLVALGFTLIFGVLNRFNIAHGATIMVAGYAGATIALLLGGDTSYPVLALSFLASLVAGAVTGLCVWATAFLPLQHASPLAPFATSAAAALILEESFVQISRNVRLFAPEFTLLTTPLEDSTIPIAGIYIRGAYVAIFVVAILLMLALSIWIGKSRMGRAVRAVEENEQAAALMGVNVRKVEIAVFVVASAAAGAAGSLVSFSQGFVNPSMGSGLLLTAFVVIVLAGMGNLYGAVICGIAVGAIETTIVGLVSASAKEAVLFVVLFGVLLIRPQGIFARAGAGRD